MEEWGRRSQPGSSSWRSAPPEHSRCAVYPVDTSTFVSSTPSSSPRRSCPGRGTKITARVLRWTRGPGLPVPGLHVQLDDGVVVGVFERVPLPYEVCKIVRATVDGLVVDGWELQPLCLHIGHHSVGAGGAAAAPASWRSWIASGRIYHSSVTICFSL